MLHLNVNKYLNEQSNTKKNNATLSILNVNKYLNGNNKYERNF